jgi:diaminohydroxyphosphoribosylaminopyrimidine deaminase/5-amino-6-(5-phosphoribosylamino)uracil reductase
MNSDKMYMSRCLDLAIAGQGYVAPNPLVGAVIVYNEKIIGEGYHEKFGGRHAEVNAIEDAIRRGNEELLSESTLYVNLEPCSHHGKTPPCTELIIRQRIPRVVIGIVDPFEGAKGRGVQQLISAGCDVRTGILGEEARFLNRRFLMFHESHRPYVILKFAKTFDGYIAPMTGDRKISNELTDTLTHKWRAEEAAIMIGTRTAEKDDPHLTVRHWTKNNPIRIVVDRTLRLPSTLHLFDGKAQTIVFNEEKDEQSHSIAYVKVSFDSLPEAVMQVLFERNIQSVIVEGGKNLLSQFIDRNLWDEARIITSERIFNGGLKAPDIRGRRRTSTTVTGDEIVVLDPL